MYALAGTHGVACVGIRAFAGFKLPTGVDKTSGVVKGNYFYVVGGAINPDVAQSTVYIYDCNAGTWAAGKRTSSRLGPDRASAHPGDSCGVRC